MNIIDFILLAPLAYGLVRGMIKGLIYQLSGLLATVVGYLAAAKYANQLSTILHETFGLDEFWVHLFSYLLIFGAVALAFYALGKMLTRTLQFMALGFVNRLLGGLFGFCKMLLILLVILYLIYPAIGSSFAQSAKGQDSLLLAFFIEYAETIGNLWKTSSAPVLPTLPLI